MAKGPVRAYMGKSMSNPVTPIALNSRAAVQVRGPDWRPFLQNLLTNDVETLPVGQARFTALLTPQGRLLYDLFVVAQEDGALLDVEAAWRDALIQRLLLYKLRAKVAIEASDLAVSASFSSPVLHGGGGPSKMVEGASDETPGDGVAPSTTLRAVPLPREVRVRSVNDPRLPALGQRHYGDPASAPEALYDAHRLALGVPGPADWGTDKTYPIEADFDLLNGIDFQKGCFVGQETTSRMKRRGTIKSRMLPIAYDGEALPHGMEILNGSLRAGEVLSGVDGRSIALVRLDRIEDGPLTADGRPVTVIKPDWLALPLT